jgi:FMN phosphatase YigB (HAD superfamily)
VFEVLLHRYRVDAGGAVFVDDSAVNVAAATSVGLRGVRFVDARALRRELVAAGLLPPDT